jgi:hypothetical protein
MPGVLALYSKGGFFSDVSIKISHIIPIIGFFT